MGRPKKNVEPQEIPTVETTTIETVSEVTVTSTQLEVVTETLPDMPFPEIKNNELKKLIDASEIKVEYKFEIVETLNTYFGKIASYEAKLKEKVISGIDDPELEIKSAEAKTIRLLMKNERNAVKKAIAEKTGTLEASIAEVVAAQSIYKNAFKIMETAYSFMEKEFETQENFKKIHEAKILSEKTQKRNNMLDGLFPYLSEEHYKNYLKLSDNEFLEVVENAKKAREQEEILIKQQEVFNQKNSQREFRLKMMENIVKGDHPLKTKLTTETTDVEFTKMLSDLSIEMQQKTEQYKKEEEQSKIPVSIPSKTAPEPPPVASPSFAPMTMAPFTTPGQSHAPVTVTKIDNSISLINSITQLKLELKDHPAKDEILSKFEGFKSWAIRLVNNTKID